MTHAPFTPRDLETLAAAGISLAEAKRQLALFASPPRATRLIRPCTVGDGIERIAPERAPSLLARADAARRAGRFAKMVPASGAATRMFPSLFTAWRESWDLETTRQRCGDDPIANDVWRFVNELDRFPFAEELRQAAARLGVDTLADEAIDLPALLGAMLTADGLDYANLPKALLPFHRYANRWRTAFAEHLAEATALVCDQHHTCRVHLTVGETELSRFLTALATERSGFSEVQLAVSFSLQSRSTDTLAVDRDGQPLRKSDGTLVLRPGGHGALLRNLDQLAHTWPASAGCEEDPSDEDARRGADLVFVKNIDNVVRGEALAETVRWRLLLAGRLLELEEAIHAHLSELQDDPSRAAVVAASRFVEDDLGGFLPRDPVRRDPVRRDPVRGGSDASHLAQRDWLLARLDRPLRVCGVVPNVGEPGGGPFWVAGWDGDASRQIVETSQVDRSNPAQRELLAQSTHFNPVDMVCALRDAVGRPYDLDRFVDPDSAFLATKSEAGMPIRVLEHPGLWNGAMAHWNTVFVEIPLGCFAPVKTVFDLLRPAHQG